MSKNDLKKIRESLMMSKAELARKANISPITITRIENGMPCRLETKRKIILALGFKISDENKVFGSVDRHPKQRSDKERRSGLDRRLKPKTSK